MSADTNGPLRRGHSPARRAGLAVALRGVILLGWRADCYRAGLSTRNGTPRSGCSGHGLLRPIKICRRGCVETECGGSEHGVVNHERPRAATDTPCGRTRRLPH